MYASSGECQPRFRLTRTLTGLSSIAAHITIQERDMKSLENVPTSVQGSVRLYFKRDVGDDAEQLANTVHALAGGTG